MSASDATSDRTITVDAAPGAPSAELESALRAAERERERIRSERQRAELREHLRDTALRLLQGVATYATPGSASTWIPQGQSNELTNERIGLNANWRDVNEEFCRDWGAVWLESARTVREGDFVEVLRATKPRDDVASVAKLLYMRLLDAPGPEKVLEVVLADLAAARIRLVERRFALQYFFDDARREVAARVRTERRSEQIAAQPVLPEVRRAGRPGRRHADVALDQLVSECLAAAVDGKVSSTATIAAQLKRSEPEIQRSRNRIRARGSRDKRKRIRKT